MLPMATTTSILCSYVSLPHLWAYLDPGAGSMVLQVVLAGALSAIFCMKSWIRQFRHSLLVRDKNA
jgi:hypothetical protein